MAIRNELASLLLAFSACGQDAPTAIDAPAVPLDGPLTGVRAVPLEGCGYSYTGMFTIGDAAFRLQIDTGSDALAVAAAGCTDCTTAGVSPLYTPGSTAMDLHMPVSATYGDGSIKWSGELYSDQIGGGLLPPVVLDFGAITAETNFFPPGLCGSPQGILGMSPDHDTAAMPYSFPAALARSGAADVFAIHYCAADGELWLNGYDPVTTVDTPVWMAMVQQTYYSVAVDDIAVAGTSVGVQASAYGLGLVDSGGPSLVVPTPAYTAITTMVGASAAFQADFGSASWLTAHTCTTLAKSRSQIDAELPPLTMTLGEPAVTIELPATAAYLQSFPTTTGTIYCSAIYGEVGSGSVRTDLGNTLIRAGVVIFDRGRSRLGFAHAAPCDDTSARLVERVPSLRPRTLSCNRRAEYPRRYRRSTHRVPARPDSIGTRRIRGQARRRRDSAGRTWRGPSPRHRRSRSGSLRRRSATRRRTSCREEAPSSATSC